MPGEFSGLTPLETEPHRDACPGGFCWDLWKVSITNSCFSVVAERPRITTFHSRSFHYNIDEAPQEFNSGL